MSDSKSTEQKTPSSVQDIHLLRQIAYKAVVNGYNSSHAGLFALSSEVEEEIGKYVEVVMSKREKSIRRDELKRLKRQATDGHGSGIAYMDNTQLVLVETIDNRLTELKGAKDE